MRMGGREEPFVAAVFQRIHEAAKRIAALDPSDPHATLLEYALLEEAIDDMEEAIAQLRTLHELTHEPDPCDRPGLALSGGTGCALFQGDLVAAGLVASSSERLEDRIAEIFVEIGRRFTGDIDEVVIEKMKVYEFSKQKGSQGDIIDLAHLGGRLLGLGKRAVLVEPARWKGQVPKDVVQGLVEARLTENENAALLHYLEPVARSRRHNVYDAVGIGLWHLKRWPK